MYTKKTVQYGGRGVNVKLLSAALTDTVFWSSHHNSFVIAPALGKEGSRTFSTPTGEVVRLLSINGIGEIRWDCCSRDLKWARENEAVGDAAETKEAADYFELEPNL